MGIIIIIYIIKMSLNEESRVSIKKSDCPIASLRAKKEEVLGVYRELNYLFTFENFREDSYLMQSMKPDLSIPLIKI